jgi:hypothetical protein
MRLLRDCVSRPGFCAKPCALRAARKRAANGVMPVTDSFRSIWPPMTNHWSHEDCFRLARPRSLSVGSFAGSSAAPGGIALHINGVRGFEGGIPGGRPDGGFEAGIFDRDAEARIVGAPAAGDGGSYYETDGGTACTNCHGPTATSGPYARSGRRNRGRRRPSRRRRLRRGGRGCRSGRREPTGARRRRRGRRGRRDARIVDAGTTQEVHKATVALCLGGGWLGPNRGTCR